MAYGIEVYNSNGFILINSTSIACRVIASGTSTVVKKTVINGGAYNMYPVPGNVFSPNTRLWLRNNTYGQYLGTRNPSFYDAANNTSWIESNGSPIGATYSYVITDLGGTNQTNGYGLVVKNADGQVEFNSADNQFMITTTWSMDVTESTNLPYSDPFFITLKSGNFDTQFSTSPYNNGTGYIFADGLCAGGWISKSGTTTQAYAVGSAASFINTSTIRVSVSRQLFSLASGFPPGAIQPYHRINLITGVVR